MSPLICGQNGLICVSVRISLGVVVVVAMVTLAGVVDAQLGDSSFDQLDHPAIQYSTRALNDPIAALNRRLQAGQARLAFTESYGYLQSVLSALQVPVESQVVVFSKTSLQANQIDPQNPRTIYFNDSVAVAWLRGGFVIEVASQDPEQGTIFYEIDQHPASAPSFRRTMNCLRCHHSRYTRGVPGLLIRSTPTTSKGTALASAAVPNLISDHRSPFQERWGGWYVTGSTSKLPHMGNNFTTNPRAIATEPAPELDDLRDKFDTSAYLSPYSDVVALMVLEHQSHLLNLFTRLSWETRAAELEQRPGGIQTPVRPRQPFVFDAAVSEIADYMLFVDEAELPGRIAGTSGFAEEFARRGPFDRQGRSLRQLELGRRLMRYPSSYMIYSPEFDALPDRARNAIYQRMWQILSGNDKAAKYDRLSAGDRTAILQILRATKPGLPAYFGRP
jgi:hypothetical protein